MNSKFIFPFLFLFIACSTGYTIRDASDFKDADKTKPFIYAKVKLKTLSASKSHYYFSIENFLYMEIYDKIDTCTLMIRTDPSKLIIGKYQLISGGVRIKPKRIREWAIDVPNKAGFYYLGTLTQDSYGYLVFEDGNKDECDAYVKTINPDFDPKTAIVLKPKRYVKEK